ncbi:MAG: prolyl oligopeptidase family serine peptidase [Gemmataceae bacterium]
MIEDPDKVMEPDPHNRSFPMLIRSLCFTFFLLTFVSQPAANAQRPQRPNIPEGTIVHKNLEYVPNGHKRHRLDLYLPPPVNGPTPVIIWVHGGGWRNGSKDRCPAIRFVQNGYAVASINYRLTKHAIFPAQIHDCKAATRWLRANARKYNLDSQKFGAWGSSAGGHLVALLGTSGDVKELEEKGGNLKYSSRVQAVVDWYGPTDLTKMGTWHNGPRSPEALLIGGPVQKNKDKAAKANPINYVSKDDPPFLIMHGTKDKVVIPNQSELLVAALKKAQVSVEYQPIEGAGHGGKAFFSVENQQIVAGFFDQHLKRKSSD